MGTRCLDLSVIKLINELINQLLHKSIQGMQNHCVDKILYFDCTINELIAAGNVQCVCVCVCVSCVCVLCVCVCMCVRAPSTLPASKSLVKPRKRVIYITQE